MQKPNQVWQAALGELQLQMTEQTFDTWLRDTHLLKYEDGTFIVGVKSGYAKDWVEGKLYPIIHRTLVRLVGKTVKIKFVVHEPAAQSNGKVALLNPIAPETAYTSNSRQWPGNLNPRYVFENFVVGATNRLAHAASLAVIDSPADAYNPLFIYGGVGLGKTHLLNAIGHRCLAQGLQVLYISSEKFTNDLIEAIRTHTTEIFRGKYRTVDILLVDDIQFIAGKESTQEEFFHTFNALHSNGKQIVLSSDRPPKAMLTLEERLRSRFEWGLIADIQSPDWETRIAILRAKAAECHTTVSNEVLSLIASRVQSNIRELEGALNKVIALSRLTDQPLTLKVAEAALDSLLPQHNKLTADQIIGAVAQHFNLEAETLRGRNRSQAVARPRQIAMYLLREETGESLPQIGALLGGRDHTTVLYACERVAELLEENTEFRRDVAAIRQRLYNGK